MLRIEKELKQLLLILLKKVAWLLKCHSINIMGWLLVVILRCSFSVLKNTFWIVIVISRMGSLHIILFLVALKIRTNTIIALVVILSVALTASKIISYLLFFVLLFLVWFLKTIIDSLTITIIVILWIIWTFLSYSITLTIIQVRWIYLFDLRRSFKFANFFIVLLDFLTRFIMINIFVRSSLKGLVTSRTVIFNNNLVINFSLFISVWVVLVYVVRSETLSLST